MNKLSNLVEPRVAQFLGEKRVLVSDAIETILLPSKLQQTLLKIGKRQVVYLDGADSQSVLEFLHDLHGNDPRVKIASTFVWNDWEELDEACSLLIHNDKAVVSTHMFSIAPWCRTNLNKANLERAVLDSLSMEHCNLYEANLFEASLSGSRMRESSLLRANLANAKLGEVDWENCDLRGARFHGVDFYLVDLRCTIMDPLQREMLGSAGAILD